MLECCKQFESEQACLLRRLADGMSNDVAAVCGVCGAKSAELDLTPDEKWCFKRIAARSKADSRSKP